MSWILLAVLTAFFYAVYNVFIKVSAGHINEIVGAVVLQIVAAVVGGFLLIYLKLNGSSFEITNKGLLFAALAGLFVGLAEITSFFVFSKGIPASVGIPIIIGGSVVFASIIGLLFLKEGLSPIHWIAIVLVVLGVVLLAK